MTKQIPEIPVEVSDLINRFFDAPLKRDRVGGLHDIERSSLRRSEALVLASLVCILKPQNCLELGFAEGGSCTAIGAARRYYKLASRHIVLDPFQETHTKGAGLLEIERLGLNEAIEWRAERSEAFLHDRWKRGAANIDFAFVDGGHDVGQKVTDAFYLNKVLRPDGVIAFHDALLFSTASAVYYLVKECGYSIIALPADGCVLRILRSIRYVFRLGRWYSLHVIPALCRSLVALRKPIADSQN
jgi:predicted O-methyltransferase YrrM